MSLVLTNHRDKNRTIDVIDLIIKHFMFETVDATARHNLLNHIEWMRRQPEDMQVDVKFETFPENKATGLSFVIRFQNNVIPIKAN